LRRSLSSNATRQRWTVVYYRDRHGREPVDAFIDAQPPDHQEALDRKIDRLNELGPMLPAPHSKQVREKIRRLKADYRGLAYRVLYREAENGFIVLLHAFVKKSPRIPPAEADLAEARWKDFRARMDAERRVPPRAIGHDAP
jgi:phage-related protein